MCVCVRLYTVFIGSCQNTVAVDHAGYYRSLNQIVMNIFAQEQGLGVRRRVPPFRMVQASAVAAESWV